MSDPLSPTEAKELIHLCKAGRLYEVEAWIRAGRSIAMPAGIRKTPLNVAVETGFHSLIELLLRHEESQQVKNDTLHLALALGRPELIALALAQGAEVAAVPFLDVLLTGNRAIVTTFLEHGADPLTDWPFARAFCELRAKTILGSFLDCRRMRPDLESRLQDQADMALRQFCQEGHLKWVSLMLWAGANSRTSGPAVDDLEHADDPDWHTTALQEACASGNVKILKRLEPNSSDDLAAMLDRAAFSAHRDVLAYLLDLGADPNDKAGGGSSALESCIRHLGWEDFDQVRYGRQSAYQTPGHKVSKGREAIKLLLERGAVWRPESSALNETRRILYRIEPAVTVELIGTLLRTTAGETGVRELLRVPRMQQHLASCASQLSGLGLTPDGRRRPPEAVTPTPASAPTSFDRGRLYDEVWSRPLKEIAGKYGTSETALLTICGKLEIPTPPSSYWSRTAAGESHISRPTLLPLGFRKARG